MDLKHDLVTSFVTLAGDNGKEVGGNEESWRRTDKVTWRPRHGARKKKRPLNVTMEKRSKLSVISLCSRCGVKLQTTLFFTTT